MSLDKRAVTKLSVLRVLISRGDVDAADKHDPSPIEIRKAFRSSAKMQCAPLCSMYSTLFSCTSTMYNVHVQYTCTMYLCLHVMLLCRP